MRGWDGSQYKPPKFNSVKSEPQAKASATIA